MPGYDHENIAKSVQLGEGVVIFKPALVNLYGCVIGDFTTIGPFVEIQQGVRVGRNCKISSHAFLCEGVSIDDGVFIGHGVMFTNDRLPRALNDDGSRKGEEDWTLERTHIGRNVSLGSGCVILPGLSVGEGAMVGAGSVVTKDVPANVIVAGNPAKIIGDRQDEDAVE